MYLQAVRTLAMQSEESASDERKREEANFDRGLGRGLVGASLATFLSIFLFAPVGIFLWVYLPTLFGADPNIFPQTFAVIFIQSVTTYLIIVIGINLPLALLVSGLRPANLRGYMMGVFEIAIVISLVVLPFVALFLSSLPVL